MDARDKLAMSVAGDLATKYIEAAPAGLSLSDLRSSLSRQLSFFTSRSDLAQHVGRAEGRKHDESKQKAFVSEVLSNTSAFRHMGQSFTERMGAECLL